MSSRDKMDGYRAPDIERAPEPDDGHDVTQGPTPAPFLTTADAANARLAARRRERERKQQTIADRRNRDGQRTEVFERGANVRQTELATGRLISGSATAADIERVRADAINRLFEARRVDMTDTQFSIAHGIAMDRFGQAAYANATPEQFVDAVLHRAHLETPAAEPSTPTTSTGPEGQRNYIKEMQRARRQGGTVAGKLRTFRG